MKSQTSTASRQLGLGVGVAGAASTIEGCIVVSYPIGVRRWQGTPDRPDPCHGPGRVPRPGSGDRTLAAMESSPIKACNHPIYRGLLAHGPRSGGPLMRSATGDRITPGGRQRCLTYDA